MIPSVSIARVRPRSVRHRGWVLAAATGVATLGVSLTATPAGANGLGWETSWTAPIAAIGTNGVDASPTMAGRAAPPLAGNPARVDYTVTPDAGLPPACAIPGDRASLTGQVFSFTPAFRCNGTYTVGVVARSGGLVPTNSPGLRAAVALADPGPAPGGLSSASNSANREVSVAWTPDGDPDVVGCRIRCDAKVVADVGANARLYTDTAPGPGTFGYDVQTLRWGRGGPGSPSIASPASASVTETITAATGGASPASAAPSGSGAGAPSSTAAGGVRPEVPAAAPALPRAPTSTPAPAPMTNPTTGRNSSRTYRPGGTIAPSSGGEVDTYAERLPYQPRSTTRAVEVNEPDQAQTVARTVATPGRERPGLLVPIGVGLVLLAASLQIRAFLARTARAGRAPSSTAAPHRDA